MMRPKELLRLAAAALTLALMLSVIGSVPSGYAQTVPTITPTSPPGQLPSPTPGGGQPPPTSQPSSATPPPSPTTAVRATSTRPTADQATRMVTRQVTPGPSPTALFSGAAAAMPTAESCSTEPTIRVASRGAWIYTGPGEDYDQVGRLAAGTVRPLIGRAASAAWWLVALDAGESAWIADDDVTIQGDTSDVAVVSAPPLPSGATPTPGPTWAPTPNPRCLEPTPTARATATTKATAAPPTPTVSPSATASLAVEDVTATPEVETAPLPDDDNTDRLFWLPVAGLVLLAAGAFLYATRRS